jgi:hypothetical protein
MGNATRRGGREDVERELDGRATEERRQRSGSTPTEDVMERAMELDPDVFPLEHEPGVEWHAGEDAGEVPDPDPDVGEGAIQDPGASPT